MEKRENLGSSQWNSKKTELTKRLGTLANVKVSAQNREDFLESLLEIKGDLERCYENLQASPKGSDTEGQYLERISILEDTRFEMLDKINGQSIDGYTQYPVDIA